MAALVEEMQMVNRLKIIWRMGKIALIVGGVFSLYDSPASADFTYTNFSNTTGLRLNGTTVQINNGTDGNVLRLVPAQQQTAGSEFYTTPVKVSSFSTRFSFRATGRSGLSDGTQPGGDGIVFFISPSPTALGGAGEGQGYSGISPSVGVEFDTWKNDWDNDPSSNHIGINLNGVISHDTSYSFTSNVTPDFDDGNLWNAWVEYDGTTLRAWASQQSQRGASPIVSRYVAIPSLFGGNSAYVGLSAGTGSAYGIYDLVSWSYAESVPEPGTWMLIAVGGVCLVASAIKQRNMAGVRAFCEKTWIKISANKTRASLSCVQMFVIPLFCIIFTISCAATLEAGYLFRDDFNGSISSQWSIQRQDASYYGIQSDSLDLRANGGDLWITNNTAENMFLVNNPTNGDFVVTMRLKSFEPPLGTHAPQVDIFAYDDDDNYVRCDYGVMSQSGGQRSIELATEVNTSYSAQYKYPIDFGSSPFYLRLTKVGNTYSQYYSTDGISYLQANTPVAYGDGTPAKLGFTAMVDHSESVHAYIDYFDVSPAPEPSIHVLFGAGALCLMAGWLWRHRNSFGHI
jgi:hypothetical protein